MHNMPAGAASRQSNPGQIRSRCCVAMEGGLSPTAAAPSGCQWRQSPAMCERQQKIPEALVVPADQKSPIISVWVHLANARI